MFGLDFETLVILAILAFILFGPQKLPEYAAKLGALIAKLREASSDLSRQAQTSFPDLLPPAAPPSGHRPTPWQPPPIPPESPCPKCSQEVGPDFAYCPHCGHHLNEGREAPPIPPISICPRCSHDVGPNFAYCPHCGHHLKEEREAPPPPLPPPPPTPAS